MTTPDQPPTPLRGAGTPLGSAATGAASGAGCAGASAKAAGRDPDRIGIECIIPPSATPAEARDRITQLADLGVSHVSYSLMSLGLGGASAHIDALKGVWDAVGDLAD